MTYSNAQKIKANEVLGGYASQGAVFSNEVFQRNDYIFRAALADGSVKFAVIGKGGKVLDHGWA